MRQENREKYLRRLLFGMCLLSQMLPIGYFIYIAVVYHRTQIWPVIVLGIVVSAASDYILFCRVLKSMDEEHLREKFQIVHYRKELQEKYISDMERNEEENTLFREKLLKQLDGIKSRIEKQDKKEIEESVGVFQQTLDVMRNEYFCENIILNMVLTDKKKCAEEQGISFQAVVSAPQDLSVESADLCSIFGNLLDNAMEACGYLQDGERREISVKCGMKGTHFIVKVENTYNPTVLKCDGKGYKSIKRETKNHGLGIQIVKKTVEKYDGELIISQKDRYFIAITYLNCGVKERGGRCVG